MSTIVELSIFPIDKGGHLSAYVARALRIVRESGLSYQLGPMGTCIEGEWSEVMSVVTQCFDALRDDCDRISVHLKADYRRGTQPRMSSKVLSVEEKI